MVTNIVEAGLESICWCIETCLGVNFKLFRALQHSTPFFVLYVLFVCVNLFSTMFDSLSMFLKKCHTYHSITSMRRWILLKEHVEIILETR